MQPISIEDVTLSIDDKIIDDKIIYDPDAKAFRLHNIKEWKYIFTYDNDIVFVTDDLSKAPPKYMRAYERYKKEKRLERLEKIKEMKQHDCT